MRLITALICTCVASSSAGGEPRFHLQLTDGRMVPNNKWEYEEQKLIFKWLRPQDRVLMMGGNVGGGCLIADQLLTNGSHAACVEPNPALWSTLEANKRSNNAQFRIVKQVVSNRKTFMKVCDGMSKGTCSTTATSASEDGSWQQVDSIDLHVLERQMFHATHGFSFLIFDCEGCACSFFSEYPDILARSRAIMLEVDDRLHCNYTQLFQIFQQANLRPVHETKPKRLANGGLGISFSVFRRET